MLRLSAYNVGINMLLNYLKTFSLKENIKSQTWTVNKDPLSFCPHLTTYLKKLGFSKEIYWVRNMIPSHRTA